MAEIEYTHSRGKIGYSWESLVLYNAKQLNREAAGDIASILYKTSNTKPYKCEKIEVKIKFQEELRNR